MNYVEHPIENGLVPKLPGSPTYPLLLSPVYILGWFCLFVPLLLLNIICRSLSHAASPSVSPSQCLTNTIFSLSHPRSLGSQHLFPRGFLSLVPSAPVPCMLINCGFFSHEFLPSIFSLPYFIPYLPLFHWFLPPAPCPLPPFPLSSCPHIFFLPLCPPHFLLDCCPLLPL